MGDIVREHAADEVCESNAESALASTVQTDADTSSDAGHVIDVPGIFQDGESMFL